jgi:predicted permease
MQIYDIDSTIGGNILNLCRQDPEYCSFELDQTTFYKISVQLFGILWIIRSFDPVHSFFMIVLASIYKPVIILFIVALFGVLAYKLKIIQPSFQENLAGLIFNITLPLLIFTTLLKIKFSAQILVSTGIYLVMAYLMVFIMLGVGTLGARLLRLDIRASNIFVIHSGFGNVVFIGYPLMNALFPGGMGLYYACLFHIVSNSLLWTLGVYILTRQGENHPRFEIKKIFNINTIAFLSGLIFLLLGIKLPGVIDEALSGLGSTTLYLSLIYIGILLAQSDLRNFYRRSSAYVLILNKMILVPIFFYFAFGFLMRWLTVPMDLTALQVSILQAGMPAMNIVVVAARKFGADDQHAMENVLLTTIPAILTLSLLYMIMN